MERGEGAPRIVSEILKELDYNPHFTYELVEEWAQGIPTYKESDPNDPEWQPTPLTPIDLSSEGLGEVYVKDESNRSSNPTGTMKDRPAWEFATLYRDMARALELKVASGVLAQKDVEQISIPRFTVITSGNEGTALATAFEKYNLPPPKLILDLNTPINILNYVKGLRADSYRVNLSSGALTPEDIKRLSHNSNGVDITSFKPIEPNAVFYDWHVHEVFNDNPDEIYVPYGSGRLMENYLTWQYRTNRNESGSNRDPRLKVDPVGVISANIFGVEPSNRDSIADKLTAEFKPFLIFEDKDIKGLVDISITGRETGVNEVTDDYIQYAQQLLTTKGITAEPSGAASLAYYIKRFQEGKISANKKVVVVNSGSGLTSTI